VDHTIIICSCAFRENIFFCRGWLSTRKWWPFNTGDCLIELTTGAGLTNVYIEEEQTRISMKASLNKRNYFLWKHKNKLIFLNSSVFTQTSFVSNYNSLGLVWEQNFKVTLINEKLLKKMLSHSKQRICDSIHIFKR
jgi:hypothetical protein